jgi:hypothetical protein
LATQPATLPMPPPDWKPATEPYVSSTKPTTLHATTQSTTSGSADAADPLATPESTVRRFLDLCGTKVLSGDPMPAMRAMIVEPPPDDQLAKLLDRVRRRLLRGATWEIVKMHQRGPAAVVIYKTNYLGRSLGGALTLLQGHDDRWRLIVGDLTAARYTPGEKEAMALEAAWAKDRLAELNAALAASQPATTQATTSPSIQSAPQ